MCSEGYDTWSACLCVCVSACPFLFSATRRNKIAKSLRQRVWHYICLILKFVKTKLWRENQVNKPMCKLAQAYLDKMCLLSVPWRLKKSQPRECIDSRMLSTTVASLCQTIRRLLAENHE